MLRRFWQWLKSFFQRLFGSKHPSPQSGEHRKVELLKQPTDAEYEALFLELLAGVNEGWSQGRVKGFLDANRITQAGLVQWLQRFGERLLASPMPNYELAQRMVQLGELSVREIGEVAGEIGMRLLRRDEATNRQGAEDVEERQEGDAQTITLDKFVRLQQDENIRQQIVQPLINQLNPADDLNVNEAETYLKQGNEQFEAGNFVGAIVSYNKAIEFKPDDYDAWYNRGVALGNLRRFEEEIASYDKAIEFKPDDYDAWYSRGLALGKLGQFEEAVASYDKAIEFKPDYYEVWYNRGNALDNLGRFEEAVASFDKAIEFKPDYYEVWNNRGVTLDKLGQFEEAVASYDKAIKFKPDFHGAWNNRGLTLDKLGQFEEAVASYDKAIKFKPDFHGAWNNRGLTLVNLGQFEEAVASFDKAIEFKLDDYETWRNRGLALRNLGQFEEAVASYDKAIEFKPDYYEAWLNRGVELRNLGRFEEEIPSYDKAIEFKPDFYDAWLNRGVALGNLGQVEEAIASFDKAIEFKPDYHQAWHNRGVALDKLGQFEEAVASFDKAIEFKPDFYDAWYNRGAPLYNLGQFEEAVASFDKAIEFKPDFHDAWLSRGIAAGNSVSCDPLLAFMSAIARLNPHLNQRGYEGKLASYEEGLKYCQQETHPEGWGMLYQAIGNAYYFRGRDDFHPHAYWHKAVNSYYEALKTLTEADFPQLHLKVLQDLIRVLLALEETATAKQWRRHGLEVFTKLFNSTKTSFQKRQLAVEFISFSQMRVDVLVEDGDLVLGLEAAERNKNSYLTWILDAQKQDILSPSYTDIQQLTNPKTAIVYWHLSPFALSTFIIKHNVPQPSVISTPSFLYEFESWVKQWNRQYEEYRKSKGKQVEQQNNWHDNLPQMLRQLGNILNISAILSEINNESIQNLILLPHRDLHRFPLHALFPDHFTTTYLPSAQVGISLQQIASTSDGEVHQLLSVEHPESTGFDILPHAEIESAAINQLFNHPNNKRIYSEQATNTAVKEALAAQYNIFHFTGHGSYDFQYPKQSALVLSGEDKLTVEEICKINFSGYQLVTLAACETALTGNQTIENEYVGLVSAFVYQGVTNVLSTLWTVNDDASSLLVMYFYWQLKKGKPPAIALAKAKKWFRNLTNYKLERLYQVILKKLPQDEKLLRPHVRNKLWQFRDMEVADSKQKYFDDPYYWAAFTITGDFTGNLPIINN